MYDKDDVVDFSEKIDQLLVDGKLRAAMSANSIRTVEEEASISRMINQMGLALGFTDDAEDLVIHKDS